MMFSNKFLNVKKQYVIKDAPTGESIRYVTEDGTIWKPCSINAITTYVTGNKYGILKIEQKK